MGTRQVLKALMPPVLVDILRPVWRKLRPSPSEGLAYAPQAWQTAVPPGDGHEARAILDTDIAEWSSSWGPYLRRLEAQDPLALPVNEFPPQACLDQLSLMQYAYVFALASREARTLRILDYGGGLGYYYCVARAVLPGVAIEYHCKEVPAMVREGRRLNPGVIWHEDDSCLDEAYDLVMFGSSLQYLRQWRQQVKLAARATTRYAYFADTPIVTGVPGFLALQRLRGAAMPYQVLNKADLLAALADAGLCLLREFPESGHIWIDGAPEQPRYYGCLLRPSAGTT